MTIYWLYQDEMQLFLGFAFPVFLYIMNFSLDLGLPPVMVVGLGFIGFFMPQMHCGAMKKTREMSVRIDMPFYIDLLVIFSYILKDVTVY